MGEALLSSTKAARAVIAKTAKEKVEGMKTIEAERQRAVRWANYLQGKDRDFWKGLVDQHKVATDYEGKSLEISLAGKRSRKSYSCLYLYRSCFHITRSCRSEKTSSRNHGCRRRR